MLLLKWSQRCSTLRHRKFISRPRSRRSSQSAGRFLVFRFIPFLLFFVPRKKYILCIISARTRRTWPSSISTNCPRWPNCDVMRNSIYYGAFTATCVGEVNSGNTTLQGCHIMIQLSCNNSKQTYSKLIRRTMKLEVYIPISSNAKYEHRIFLHTVVIALCTLNRGENTYHLTYCS